MKARRAVALRDAAFGASQRPEATDLGPPMRISLRLLACALVASAAVPARAVQLPPQPALTDAQLTARCKAKSFARHPPGTMSNTMRELAIDRCVKNKGFLD